MMVYIENIEIELEQIDCCACGTIFAVPQRLLKNRRETGKEFYCPNGHSLFFGKTKIEALTEEIDWYRQKLKDEREELVQTKRSLRGPKAALTRTKNRIKNGVCPCCKRHFENLQRHIETKHPHFTEQEQ